MKEEYRVMFQNFRALLNANNNSLEIMAELEQALAGGQNYSMAFIRARSTAIAVNVYKMINHLMDMSEGRYATLDKSFVKIKHEIEAILTEHDIAPSTKWLFTMSEVDRSLADQVGEKMANLGEIGNLGDINVPPGFAITAGAGHYFLKTNNLQDEINRQLQTLDPDNLESLYRASSAIQQFITRAPLQGDLEEAILTAYDKLSHKIKSGITVAMRSSALGEDSSQVSFAGQYHSQLSVSREFLGHAYKEIIASKYTSQAIIYRLKRGFRDEDAAMAVGCLAMIDGTVSGVLYSREPENIRSRWILLNWARGLADSVVNGSGNVQQLLIGRDAPHEKNPPLDKSGLTEQQYRELVDVAVRLEKHFGSPQDIEWSFDQNGKLFILQSRPLTFLEPRKNQLPRHENSDLQALYCGKVTASPGVACGPVYLVHSNLDLLQFPDKAILVTPHPLPRWAPLLNRAVAVVTETGGVAGHLATVSREFGIPALFGVDGACRKLRNDEIITVDASGCCIYPGRDEKLLALAEKPRNLMDGSPVQKTMKVLLQHIVPLHLTNPDSPYFKPSSCRTLHDITRFCHEKSVFEMFNFGKRHHATEMTAKKIKEETTVSDWLVIDLDDGFRPEADRSLKTISITEIVSRPMLALWEGIHAIPWQGPPPVNVKGFGSILFRSTMNPGFEPSLSSPLTKQNYFLISKEFCNVSIRLGYHFTMAEAFVSDRLSANYIGFHFKGGAADKHRKSRRTQLIGDILQEFDFRIEQKGDALSARLERLPPEKLMERLRMLGYLIMHTRQIDMVMTNKAAVDRYRDKLMNDINTIITPTQLCDDRL